jgi:phospholipid/cholesterol/gamma-HCH transport system substrate-binding protein
MRFRLGRHDQLVGVFVLGGLVFLAAALVLLGQNKRWFQHDPEYRSHFDTAEGLRVGLDLEMQGFAVGRVKQMRLTDDRLVEVVFSVHAEHADLVRPDSVVELVVQPLGFGAKLVLYPGRGDGPPLAEGALIPSTDLPAGRALVDAGAVFRPQRRDEAGLVLAALPDLVAEIHDLVATTGAMVTRLDRQLLGAPEAAGAGLVGSASHLMHSIDSTVTRAGQATARVVPMLARLESVLAHLDTLAARLADPAGVAPALLGDEGSAARLFQDDGALYDELEASLAELRQILSFFRESTPDLAVLVDEATAAMDASEKVAQGLKNNPLLRGGIPPDETAGQDTYSGFRGEER